jgi:hypothetical protein
MNKPDEPTVIGSLPHARPQRRSPKRAAKPDAGAAPEPEGARTAKPPRAAAPRKAPAGSRKIPAASPKAPAAPRKAAAGPRPAPEVPAPTPSRTGSLPEGAELVGTVVKAAAELAEIGLTIGLRTLRGAVRRIPRP